LQNCPYFAHYRGSFAIKQGQSCNWKTKNRSKHAKKKIRGKCVVGLQNKGSLAILP
jgi:hypothetical protein